MKVRELVQALQFHVFTEESGLDREITGAYVCDLLSWVMSHAKKGDVWITVHTHLNIVAVALLTEVPCIIIPENIPVEEATIKKAGTEGIAILGSGLSAYDICCNIYRFMNTNHKD